NSSHGRWGWCCSRPSPLSPPPVGEGALAFFLDSRLRLRSLVPRFGAARCPHRTFVAFARKQHSVARLRDLDGATDRGPAVDHDLEIAARSLPFCARLHIARDLDRILAQRIVRRDDEEIAELGSRATHPGPV